MVIPSFALRLVEWQDFVTPLLEIAAKNATLGTRFGNRGYVGWPNTSMPGRQPGMKSASRAAPR
jgi:hypothetical protein